MVGGGDGFRFCRLRGGPSSERGSSWEVDEEVEGLFRLVNMVGSVSLSNFADSLLLDDDHVALRERLSLYGTYEEFISKGGLRGLESGASIVAPGSGGVVK